MEASTISFYSWPEPCKHLYFNENPLCRYCPKCGARNNLNKFSINQIQLDNIAEKMRFYQHNTICCQINKIISTDFKVFVVHIPTNLNPHRTQILLYETIKYSNPIFCSRPKWQNAFINYSDYHNIFFIDPKWEKCWNDDLYKYQCSQELGNISYKLN